MALIFSQTLTLDWTNIEHIVVAAAVRHSWTACADCFGSGVAAVDDDALLGFSFLLLFSDFAEAAANEVSSFFFSCVEDAILGKCG